MPTLCGLRGVPCRPHRDRKSTRLNSSHTVISYAVFCLKKKKTSLNSTHTVISDDVFCLKKNNIDVETRRFKVRRDNEEEAMRHHINIRALFNECTSHYK